MRSRAVTATGLLLSLFGSIGASAPTRIVFAFGVAVTVVGMFLMARYRREGWTIADVGLFLMGTLVLAWTLLVYVVLASLGL